MSVKHSQQSVLPNVTALTAEQPFFEVCAEQLMARYDACGLNSSVVITPNQRMAKHLLQAMKSRNEEQAVLSPVLLPLNQWQKEDLLALFAHEDAIIKQLLALPAVMDNAKRQSIFAKQIQKFGNYLAPFLHMPRALQLAKSLMQLQDQILLHDVNPETLQELLNSYSSNQYDRAVKQLFAIILQHWPEISKEENALGEIEFQLTLQNIMIRHMDALATKHNIYMIGSTGSISTTRRLMQAVHSQKRGHLMLPGAPAEGDDHEKPEFLHVMRTLQSLSEGQLDVGISNISGSQRPTEKPEAREVVAPNAEQEAKAIALIVKDQVMNSTNRCLVVSADDALTRNIVKKMAVIGVHANHLPNQALAQHSLMRCLNGVAAFICNDANHYALRAVLSAVKPSISDHSKYWREAVHHIDSHMLRQQNKLVDSAEFFEISERAQDYIEAFKNVCSQLSGLKKKRIPAHQWLLEIQGVFSQYALEITATHEPLILALQGYALLGDLEADEWLQLLSGMASENMATDFDGNTPHPKVHVLSPVEARLQQSECVILAGFHHEAWPKTSKQNGWLNQRMREELGLPVFEDELALAAHDVWMHANAAKICYVTRASVYNGKPVMPSPLWSLLKLHAEEVPYVQWASQQYQPERYEPEALTRVNPPVAARPSTISVSRLNDLLKDPYRFYAQSMLGLQALNDYINETEQREFGTIAHRLMEFIIGEKNIPSDKDILHFIEKQLRGISANKTLSLFWRKQLGVVSDYALKQREVYDKTQATCLLEKRIQTDIALLDGAKVTLKGSLDLVKKQADGSLSIIDYKTGQHASEIDVKSGRDAQLIGYGLLLESEENAPNSVGYVKLPDIKQGAKQVLVSFTKQEYLEKKAQLIELIGAMKSADTVFLAHPLQALNIDSGDSSYDGVSRFAESV